MPTFNPQEIVEELLLCALNGGSYREVVKYSPRIVDDREKLAKVNAVEVGLVPEYRSLR